MSSTGRSEKSRKLSRVFIIFKIKRKTFPTPQGKMGARKYKYAKKEIELSPKIPRDFDFPAISHVSEKLFLRRSPWWWCCGGSFPSKNNLEIPHGCCCCCVILRVGWMVHVCGSSEGKSRWKFADNNEGYAAGPKLSLSLSLTLCRHFLWVYFLCTHTRRTLPAQDTDVYIRFSCSHSHTVKSLNEMCGTNKTINISSSIRHERSLLASREI